MNTTAARATQHAFQPLSYVMVFHNVQKMTMRPHVVSNVDTTDNRAIRFLQGDSKFVAILTLTFTLPVLMGNLKLDMYLLILLSHFCHFNKFLLNFQPVLKGYQCNKAFKLIHQKTLSPYHNEWFYLSFGFTIHQNWAEEKRVSK